MPARAIGLDIGTFAVRAAEVAFGGSGARVTRFGQLTLPPGAVAAGEVVDVDTVAGVIRRLWERVGFHSRSVVLGLANQRVLVRLTDLPAMSDAEVAEALQFQDTQILPIAPEEARVDFQRLEEFVNEEGSERVRLLIASAQRTMLATHLEAVEAAGLRVVRVDPMPLALVRSIGRTGLSVLEDEVDTEALICVGAGVTTIVVHEGGIPRFARFLSEGAGAATEAVALELGVDLDAAEDLKRRVGTGLGVPEAAEVAVSRVVARLVDDIDSSIRFYSSQNAETPVGRIVITGAGSRLAGLLSRLADTTGLPVEAARPMELFPMDAGLTQEELARAEPNLASVIGLALAGAGTRQAERRINLLPTSIEVVRQQRTQAIIAGAALAGIALLLIAAWAVRGQQTSSQQHQADASQQQAQSLQSQINRLSRSGTAAADLSQSGREIQTALTGDIDWTGLLTQIANVIPDDVWITSMSATSTASGTTPASGAAAGAGLGLVSFNANGFDQTSTARWITDLDQLGSLTSLWVASSQRAGANGLVTFTSTADLASGALSDRVGQFTGGNS